MKRLFFCLVVLSVIGAKAQTYKVLTDSALHVMWKSTDTIGERNALNLYEKAFKLYPKEIENLALYKAAVLSGYLGEIDKAFIYLGPVAKDGARGNKGWEYILDQSPKGEFANLLNDPRWKVLEQKAGIEKATFLKGVAGVEKDFKAGGLQTLVFKQNETGKQVYEKIKAFTNFSHKHYKNFSVKLKVTDSLSTAYYVSLPKNYDPKKRYALLFFLHGAVSSNGFAKYIDEGILEDWNRFYTKYAALNNVIMVYLQGSRKFNWMVPNDGFFMVPKVIKEIKQSINIDDNKVFLTGHSNGATGSFSYLMKQQSPFAGFYGFNTQPKVRTGGTFVKNILNRSYFNVSTDEDYYFPPDANDSLTVLMKKLGADYQDHRFNGFPHWFPQFDESEPVYKLIFADIAKRNRNPFHSEIYWECDDVNYGKADWVAITKLDTLGKKQSWHQNINFNIHKLLGYNKNDDLVTKDTLLKAFNFPRKSGAIKGYFKNNEFHLETSAVASVSIFVSPEMVDMTKPVTIFVNGKKKASKKLTYNKELILKNFNETFDRKAVWVDKIDVVL